MDVSPEPILPVPRSNPWRMEPLPEYEQLRRDLRSSASTLGGYSMEALATHYKLSVKELVACRRQEMDPLDYLATRDAKYLEKTIQEIFAKGPTGKFLLIPNRFLVNGVALSEVELQQRAIAQFLGDDIHGRLRNVLDQLITALRPIKAKVTERDEVRKAFDSHLERSLDKEKTCNIPRKMPKKKMSPKQRRLYVSREQNSLSLAALFADFLKKRDALKAAFFQDIESEEESPSIPLSKQDGDTLRNIFDIRLVKIDGVADFLGRQRDAILEAINVLKSRGRGSRVESGTPRLGHVQVAASLGRGPFVQGATGKPQAADLERVDKAILNVLRKHNCAMSVVDIIASMPLTDARGRETIAKHLKKLESSNFVFHSGATGKGSKWCITDAGLQRIQRKLKVAK